MTSRYDLLDVKRAHETLDEQTKARREAWDRYMDGVCKGLPEAELAALYWRAAKLTDEGVQ